MYPNFIMMFVDQFYPMELSFCMSECKQKRNTIAEHDMFCTKQPISGIIGYWAVYSAHQLLA